jgi:hypothetical protein
MSSYVPLWCQSNFSFLEGASHPDELVDEASRLGLPALALTDRDGVYGVVRAHVKAREVGLKTIIGSEMTIDDGSTIVLLAQDRGGYANLCRLISKGRLRSEKGESSVGWNEVCAHAPGLIALWVETPETWIPAFAGMTQSGSLFGMFRVNQYPPLTPMTLRASSAMRSAIGSISCWRGTAAKKKSLANQNCASGRAALASRGLLPMKCFTTRPRDAGYKTY